MKPIIEVNHLSKKYRYGESQPYYTLRDTITGIIKAPFQLLDRDKKQTVLRKDEFWALKDISFKLNRGDVLGVIGPNGSGKSTLLKVLSQITPPTKGEALLRGRVGSLLEVGTGFQQELTGLENIYLNGAILGMRRWEINRKLDAIIDFSGVEKFLDTPVKHYSSGMYMRLAFAVAAHLDSEILIVDEVLSVGDAEFQRKCLGKMGEITKKEGRTILFVSHNLEAVRRLCNGCILLNKGNKVFAGGVEKTIAEYISLQSKVDLKASSRGNNINHKGSGTLSFTDIEIWDANNKRRNTFNTGETVKLKISYAIYKNMEGLHLIISLFSSKVSGLLLTDMRHEIKSGAAIKGERGDVVVEVKLEGLRPGEYLLDFWLGDKAAVEQNNLVNYDVVENMTKPLIIETRNESERKLTGAFSLPSKVISK
jgi:lipopolysaccharide transport system ATP-binding protein